MRRCVEESSDGLTLRTMMLVVPCRRMSSRASSMLPLPNAIMAMTAAVPMMMPSTERMERSLCSHRLRRASTKLLRHLIQSTAKPATRTRHRGRWQSIRRRS